MLSLIRTSRILTIVWLISSFSLLYACGFYFRGYKPDDKSSSSQAVLRIAIQANNADRLHQYLTAEVVSNRLQIVASDAAEYIVKLSDELFTRDILSLSAETGKVREYNVIYEFGLSITDTSADADANEVAVLDSARLRFEQDYIFDTDALLATEREEEIAEEELLKRAAQEILRRLRTAASP